MRASLALLTGASAVSAYVVNRREKDQNVMALEKRAKDAVEEYAEEEGITNPAVMKLLDLTGTGLSVTGLVPKVVQYIDGVRTESTVMGNKVVDDALHIDSNEAGTCIDLKRGDSLELPLPENIHVKFLNVFGQKELDAGGNAITTATSSENGTDGSFYKYKYFGLTASILKADGSEQSCYGPIETPPSKRHQSHHVMMLQERCYMSTTKSGGGARLKLTITGQPFVSPMKICEVMAFGKASSVDPATLTETERMSLSKSSAVINPLVMDNLTPGSSGASRSTTDFTADVSKTVDDHIHKYSGNSTDSDDDDSTFNQTCITLPAGKSIKYKVGAGNHVKFVNVFGHADATYQGLEVIMKSSGTLDDISCYGPIGWKNNEAIAEADYVEVSQKHLFMKLSERCYMTKTASDGNTEFMLKNNDGADFSICEVMLWGTPESNHMGGSL